MKTPFQWMDEHDICCRDPEGNRDASLTCAVIEKIQLDAAENPEYGRYTVKTLATPGWYFWYPARTKFNPQFTLISEEQIKWPDLRREVNRYAGTYIGPVEPPKL